MPPEGTASVDDSLSKLQLDWGVDFARPVSRKARFKAHRAKRKEKRNLLAVQEGVKLRWLPILSCFYDLALSSCLLISVYSGVLCPFSVLLEVPGLTAHWYIKTQGEGALGPIVDVQPNSPFIDGSTAVSMAFGVLANLALVSRFLEKKPYISTLVAIGSLTAHDLLNVVIVLNFGIVHRINDGYTYGEAFWLTTASSIFSVICNVTLIYDFVTTANFRLSGSGLTVKQRSVVINVMLLLCYAAIGGLVYSYTIGGLTFEDALYLSIVSVTTVGFGDLSPNNTGSRIFSLFYNTIGIILLAVTIATTRESIIESFEISYRKRREAIAEKADQRREAKKRIMALRAEAAEKLGLPEPPTPRIQRRRTSLAFAAVKHRSNSWWARCRKRLVKMGIFKSRHEEEVDKRITDRSLRRKGSMDSTLSSTEDQFDAFREKLMREERRDGTLKLVVVFGLFVVFWLVGAALFMQTEKWSYFISLYFCFVFFSTIGYGDYSPKTPGGRAVFLAYSLFAIFVMTLLFSVLTENWSTTYHRSMRESRLRAAAKRIKDQTSSEEGASQDSSVQAAAQVNADIGKQLYDAAKSFTEHARYFMHGQSGRVPESLQALHTVAVDGKDVKNLQDSVQNAETKHFLFLMSYEKALENLLEASERVQHVFTAHETELQALHHLNTNLGVALIRSQSLLGLSEAPPSANGSFVEESSQMDPGVEANPDSADSPQRQSTTTDEHVEEATRHLNNLQGAISKILALRPLPDGGGVSDVVQRSLPHLSSAPVSATKSYYSSMASPASSTTRHAHIANKNLEIPRSVTWDDAL